MRRGDALASPPPVCVAAGSRPLAYNRRLMFRLTREVRFAVNLGEPGADPQLGERPTNGFGGYPSVNGLAVFLAARVTLRGSLDPRSQYLVNIKDVDAQLRGAYTYDWSRDPFARGAYSYALVGGGDARAALAAPCDGTLFWAGEATHATGASGTVHGALASGYRAAAELLGA